MRKEKMIFLSLFAFVSLFCGLLLYLSIPALSILGISCLNELNVQSVNCVSIVVPFTVILICAVGMVLVMLVV